MKEVTIVIPTLATAQRGPYLKQAIASILAQANAKPTPLVIANGSRCDPDVLRWLQRNRDIRFLRLDAASMPNALYEGWKRVDTRYFGELDDDDELLPGALDVRLRAFRASPTIDAVVTNGIVRGESGDHPGIENFDSVVENPLRSVVDAPWLLPGAALFSRERIDESVFADIPAHLEWTYLALRLSLEYTVRFLPDKTVLHRVDLPFSTDRSFGALVCRARSIPRLLALDLPLDVRIALERKQTNACHSVAAAQLTKGRIGDAWSWHLKSLLGRGGWRYLNYTRKLLLPG